MFKFITNKPFWVNLLVAIGLFFLILFTVLQLLGVITNHGSYLKIPSVAGMNGKDAIELLEEKGFNVVVLDSVYTDTARKGIVLKQYPDAGNLVKINRTVFLTINKSALPDVDMPSLEGKSYAYAVEILRRSHLRLGDTVYRSDFMKGTVLEQSLRGRRMRSGMKVPWGSRIDLVIGSGLSNEPILVPDLIGLTYAEARALLEGNGILLGAAIPDADVTDTENAFVWKQIPPHQNADSQFLYIKPGQLMDLWLSVENKSLTDSIIDFNP